MEFLYLIDGREKGIYLYLKVRIHHSLRLYPKEWVKIFINGILSFEKGVWEEERLVRVTLPEGEYVVVWVEYRDETSDEQPMRFKGYNTMTTQELRSLINDDDITYADTKFAHSTNVILNEATLSEREDLLLGEQATSYRPVLFQTDFLFDVANIGYLYAVWHKITVGFRNFVELCWWLFAPK